MQIFIAVLGLLLASAPCLFAQQAMPPNRAHPSSGVLDFSEVKEIAKDRDAFLQAEKRRIIENLEKELLHDSIAGEQIRQGELEKDFTRQLVDAPLLPSQQEREKVRAAYRASKNPQMKRLEDTYTADIWSHVKEEMASYGHEFHIDDVHNVIDANSMDSVYDTSNLYVFVSDSVPEATLKNYLTIFEGMNVVYVLRGLIGDDFLKIMPTQQWAKNVLCGSQELKENMKCQNGPIDINPNLFRYFNIQSVPAIVYMNDTAKLDVCGDVTIKDSEFLLWYGDTNPQYVLPKFVERSPQDEKLLKLVSQIDPSLWSNAE